MKHTKIWIAFFAVLFIVSCERAGLYTQPSQAINLENSLLLKSGTFSPTSGISVNGKSEIKRYNGVNYVQLVNFSITSGPDLKVYLSKRDTPSEFVNLGALENGKTVYEIPQNTTISDYPYVLIHCQQYNHLFAIAHLQ